MTLAAFATAAGALHRISALRNRATSALLARPVRTSTSNTNRTNRAAIPQSKSTNCMATGTSSTSNRRGYQPGDRVVLYDGVCGLCNGGVQMLLKLDTAGIFRYAALQSDAGRDLLRKTGAPDDLSTVVFIDGDEAYTYSDAVLRIGEAMPGFSIPAKLALALVPRPVRDSFYTNVVASNRYWVFGRSDYCTLMHPGYEERFLE